MYNFAFQPHFPKKYRIGETNANKRHEDKPIDFKKAHQTQIILDPWIKLSSEEIRHASRNNIKHTPLT